MNKQLGLVVGIDTDMGGSTLYRVIVASISSTDKDKQYDWKFECRIMDTNSIKKAIQSGTHWLNIKLENGKLKGSTGSLTRFNNNDYRPFVIISQLINSDDKIIGYKVANYNGEVKNIPLKEMIAYGHRAIKNKNIPVQNAIFIPTEIVDGEVSRQAHFKAYPGCNFIEERIITSKNNNVDKRRVNVARNNNSLSKLNEIYTPEQIEQLTLGKQHGVDIRVYANPELSAQQMKLLRQGLEQKLNVKLFAFPEYTLDAMRYYIIELQSGMDIRNYLNSKYSIAQIAELSIAADEGLDLSKMSDPSLSVRQMQERRIRLENKVFSEHDVEREGSWI